ncbi:MAG: SLC13 family permease [Bacillota bacterium]
MEGLQTEEGGKTVLRRIGWLLTAFALMVVVLIWDFPSTLSPLGQTMLAVLVFAMTIWVTSAVGLAESSLYVIAVMGLLVTLTPDPASTGRLLGSSEGIVMALSGFDTDAWLQVVTAFFIAAAAKKTGLGDRMGLWLIGLTGSGPRNMLAGVLVMCYIMELFIPSPTGVAVLIIALLQRVMKVCGLEKGSNLAKGMMLAVAYGTATASVGILTSNAPAIQTASLIHAATGSEITWLRWFLYGEPFGLALGMVVYLLLIIFFPVEKGGLKNYRQKIRDQLDGLGPLTGPEKRLLILLLATILLWATSRTLHPLSNSNVSIITTAAIFLPVMGIGNWRMLAEDVDWGILILYGSSVSLGQWLLKSGAAQWVAGNALVALGLGTLPEMVLIVSLLAVFGIFALAFSARAAAVAALVPTAIGFASSLPGLGINAENIALISYYTIQTAAILPMHHPMAMVAHATGNFSTGEMIRLGISFMVLQVIFTGIFFFTYWKLVGLF